MFSNLLKIYDLMKHIIPKIEGQLNIHQKKTTWNTFLNLSCFIQNFLHFIEFTFFYKIFTIFQQLYSFWLYIPIIQYLQSPVFYKIYLLVFFLNLSWNDTIFYACIIYTSDNTNKLKYILLLKEEILRIFQIHDYGHFM